MRIPEQYPGAAIAEYESLFPWERGLAYRRYAYYLAQGANSRSHSPEVVRDRAIYLGYRGVLMSWMRLMIAGIVPLFILSLFVSGAGLTIVIVGEVLVEAGLFSAYVARSIQSRRRHPNYQRYKIDLAQTDWS